MNTVVSLPSSSSCSSYANASRDGERGGGALRQEMGDGRRRALFRSRRILFTLLVCLLCSPVVAARGVYKRGRRKGEECWRRDGRADGKGVRREGRSLHHLIHGLPSSPPLASQIQFLSFAPPHSLFTKGKEGKGGGSSPVRRSPLPSFPRWCCHLQLFPLVDIVLVVGAPCRLGEAKKKSPEPTNEIPGLKKASTFFSFPPSPSILRREKRRDWHAHGEEGGREKR